MKKSIILAAVVFATTVLSTSCIYAEDEIITSRYFADESESQEDDCGLLDSLLSSDFIQDAKEKGEKLSKHLPSKEEVLEIVDVVKEKSGKAASGVVGVVNDLIAGISDEVDSLDLDSLKNSAGSVLSGLFGDSGDDDMFVSLDDYLENYHAMEAAENNYMEEANAYFLNTGDVQIISNSALNSDEMMDMDNPKMLQRINQFNYMRDGNKLRFLNSSENIVLFTLKKVGDGYIVEDAYIVEDGDNYMYFLKECCKEVGCTLEDCLENIEVAKALETYDIANYIENEVSGIEFVEYDGEFYTSEGLNNIGTDNLMLLYDETEESDIE